MAVIDAVFSPAKGSGVKIAALAATTASSEQACGHNRLVSIFSTGGPITVVVGATGTTAAPTATSFDFALPAGAVLMFQMPREADAFRVFNTSAAAVDVFWSTFSQ